MECEINITPMSLKIGVLGLPISCCRDWDASLPVKGELNFEGITDSITISPKHTFTKESVDNSKLRRAKAWQFTINNSVQFAKLKLLAVNTYAEQKIIGEHLKCEVTMNNTNGNQFASIVVKECKQDTQTIYSETIRSLLKQGIRKNNNIAKTFSINWSQPSEWKDISTLNEYKNIHNCLYMWYGTSCNNLDNFDYIYVGIVGDTRGNKNKEGGQSKRTLAQRINEEQKKYIKDGIKICKFRYCNLHDYPESIDVSELLKTIEMAVITSISSLIFCDNSQSEITPIFKDKSIKLLNKMTAYRFVK